MIKIGNWKYLKSRRTLNFNGETKYQDWADLEKYKSIPDLIERASGKQYITHEDLKNLRLILHKLASAEQLVFISQHMKGANIDEK